MIIRLPLLALLFTLALSWSVWAEEYALLTVKSGSAFLPGRNSADQRLDAGSETLLDLGDTVYIAPGSLAVVTSRQTGGRLFVAGDSAFTVAPWRSGQLTGGIAVIKGSFRLENNENDHLGLAVKGLYINAEAAPYGVYADQDDGVFVVGFADTVSIFFQQTTLTLNRNQFTVLLFGDELQNTENVELPDAPYQGSADAGKVENSSNPELNIRHTALFLRDFGTGENGTVTGQQVPVSTVPVILGIMSSDPFTRSADTSSAEESRRRNLIDAMKNRDRTFQKLADSNAVISSIYGQ